MLTKSPQFADSLLQKALNIADETIKLSQLDDGIEQSAASVARQRPR
jgi:CobQ-like glutamine amidotransferase family enzyme